VLATLLAFTGFADRGGAQSLLAIVSLCALGLTMLMLSYANEQTQGLSLAPAIYVGLTLLALALLPLRPGGSLALVALLVLVAGLGWSGIAPLYSTWRPQHVSLHYLLDLDERIAQWSALSPNPLPAALNNALGNDSEQALALPWSSSTSTVSPAPYINMPPPDVRVKRTVNRIELQIRSRTSGDALGLVIPISAGVSNLRLAGQRLSAEPRGDYLQVVLFAAGQTGLNISFDIDTPEQVLAYVFDIANTLPPLAATLVDARGDLAVPQHRGDQLIAYRRVKF
jgi:hypothetical protein